MSRAEDNSSWLSLVADQEVEAPPLTTLEEVVEWYAKGGHPNPHLDEKVKKLTLTDQDKADLVAFMKACSGAFPQVATGRLPE